MYCTVPGCNPSHQEYLVQFPRNPKLAERWKEAIEYGTGRPVLMADADGVQQQLCLVHFSSEDHHSELMGYREPSIFRDRQGNIVDISCCRLCLRFAQRSQMFPKSGKMEHVSLSSTIRAVMKVSLARDDFLTEICERCLVKVDVLKSWARETLQQEMDFRELMAMARQECQTVDFELDANIKVETLQPETKLEIPDEVETPEPVSRGVSPAIDDNDPKKGSKAEEIERKETKNNLKIEPIIDIPSSSEEEELPLATLAKLRKKTKKKVVKKKNLESVLATKKVRQRKQTFPKDTIPKKRGRKPGSPKPVRQEYLRDILAKKCYICNTTVEDIDRLVAHLTETHAGKIDYKCDDCNKTFGKVTIYNRHLSCHDLTIRPRKCAFCTLCFSAKESLKIHENKVHGQNHTLPKRYKRKGKIFQCDQCGKIFLNDALLRQHDMYVHKKMPAATCQLCGKTFATKSNLEKHYIVHSNERPYKCDKCSAAYKTSTALTKHSLLHDNLLPYECRYCDERFLTQGQYAKHRVLNHAQRAVISRSMPCAICSEVFTRTTDLQKHINDTHTKIPYPYLSCPECPLQFLLEQQLTTHRNVHTDLFACSECGKHHSSAAQLRDHMESHNPSQPWQCTVCLKRFSLQSNYSRHRLIHQEEKRFKCEFCEKGFSQKGQLMNHRRTHTGERPFTCPVCGRSFSDQPTYYKHRKRCMEKDGPAEEQLQLHSCVTSKHCQKMDCAVPDCRYSSCHPAECSFVLFPENEVLRERWLQAIQLGSGLLMDRSSATKAEVICSWHFEDKTLRTYQEPNLFRDQNEKLSEVCSCRICLKFYHRHEMIPAKSKLGRKPVSTFISKMLGIKLTEEDFLQKICEECLVKLDICVKWIKDAKKVEAQFQELVRAAESEKRCFPDSTIQNAPLRQDANCDRQKQDLYVEEFVESINQDEKNYIAFEVDLEPEIENVNNSVVMDTDIEFIAIDSNCTDNLQNDLLLASNEEASKRKPGRTRIKPLPDEGVAKRKPGRPRIKSDPNEEKVKRKPGRPRINPLPLPKLNCNNDEVKQKQNYQDILSRKCYICNTLLSSHAELIGHLTTDHAAKVDYVCKDCDGKSFLKVTAFNRHLSFHDLEYRRLKCDYCSMGFSYYKNVQVHQNREHGTAHVINRTDWRAKKGKDFQCDSCGKTFRNGYQLREHDDYYHKMIYNFVCTVCGKAFPTKSLLQKHHIVHSGERPYKCDLCSETFTKSDYLHQHVRKHQDGTLKTGRKSMKSLSMN